ncbi:MAG: site-specific integrase [Actinomycetota bacterium]|nr:site-specific integrase [Actinomycetota bacterium]
MAKDKRLAVGRTRAKRKGPTTADFFEEWLLSISHSVKPSTLRRYQEYVRLHATPAFGEVRLGCLSPADLELLYASKIRDGLSPTSVLHLHSALHRALAHAQRRGLVRTNVAKLVDAPKPQRREMQSLSPEQARRFLSVVREDRLEALYVLAITTGMRQGELLGLRWRDVDLEGSSLRVTGSIQYVRGQGLRVSSPKTRRSRRQVMLSSLAVDALEQRRDTQKEERARESENWVDGDFVFTSRNGKPIYATNIVNRAFPKLLGDAGLPRIRFHDLRHTAATLLLGQGVHPKIVSEMLGHTSIGITLDLYSHATPTIQREATAAFVLHR